MADAKKLSVAIALFTDNKLYTAYTEVKAYCETIYLMKNLFRVQSGEWTFDEYLNEVDANIIDTRSYDIKVRPSINFEVNTTECYMLERQFEAYHNAEHFIISNCSSERLRFDISSINSNVFLNPSAIMLADIDAKATTYYTEKANIFLNRGADALYVGTLSDADEISVPKMAIGLRVTGIDSFALTGSKKSISILNARYIKFIQEYAFDDLYGGCKVKKLIMPESIEYVAENSISTEMEIELI